MKGIILAAGAGSRLFPVSVPISKILLPVYDKPMIYYPLCTLMSAGISDILVITSPRDRESFEGLLGNGAQFGISITYEVQHVPKGIADAFIIGEDFIDGDDVCLILGDNIFHHPDIAESLRDAAESNEYATIFGYSVHDPERFGVIELDGGGNVISLEEKPKYPKSNIAAIGLYIYDGDVCRIAKSLEPSARGELEITDLNIEYLRSGRLRCATFTDDLIWIDTGTFDSLHDAATAVRDIHEKTGKRICCPEETALSMGFIDEDDVKEWLSDKKDNEYYAYVRHLCE